MSTRMFARATLAVLTVLLSAVSTHAQQGINQKQGFNANNVYSLHEIDTVNAFNGNLSVAIPIGPEFPLADGFSYRLTLHSNGNYWESEVRHDTYTEAKPNGTREIRTHAEGICDRSDGFTVAFPHRRANAGLGWMLTLGRLYPTASMLVGGWTYQSPDGADHVFHQTLTHGTTDNDATYFTRDGSYLRLQLDETAGSAVIEFPDGSYHTFRQGTKIDDPWLPVEIAHRRSHEKLTIDYSVADQWSLTDSHGRSHTITFTAKNWESGTRPLVTSVTLDAFTPAGVAGRTATYDFEYEERTQLARPAWHERCTEWPSTARVQTLKGVTFPSEAGEGTTKYQFGYDFLVLKSPGVLTKAVLPTGGWFVWHWDTWEKPQDSAGSVHFAESTGVVKREAWMPSGTTGTKVAEWTYESTLDAPTIDAAVHAIRTTIRNPLDQTTVHYFSATVRDGTRDGVSYKAEYYGLPFTQHHQSGGRYLSQVVYPAGFTPDHTDPLNGALRATYLQYQGDGPASVAIGPEKNWRARQRREMTFTASGGSEWIDSDSSDFDGYGHYRTTKTSGSFSTASRTTTTSYLAPGTNWILGLYDRVTTTDANGNASATEFHFESDGFLKRIRKRRNAATASTKDFVTVYDDPDGDGMIDAERHYGGDAEGKALPNGYQIDGTADPSEVSHTLFHTNENGLRASTQADGVTFKTLDLDVDPTGLPRSSTDISGTYVTTFDYNLRGQLKSVTPGSDAWTEYEYSTNSSAFPPATVTVKQWPGTNTAPSATDVPLTDTRYYYDYFGRLIQERTWLSTASSSAWSVVTHQYDLLGRNVSTTVPVGRTSGEYGSVSQVTGTSTEYDVLGRVVKVTQPDGTYSDATYTGVRTVERSVSTRTEAGDQRVLTKEIYDPLGRLESVTEDSGGANDLTVYTYDEGDRLASVTQSTEASRQFSYDSSGLLTSETHPESGTSSYSYDARAHVIKKVTPTATVSTSYDAGERIMAVVQNVVDAAGQPAEVPLQSFTYGTSGTSKGRLQTAVRHNHHSALGDDVTVTETFTYDAGGRVATQSTSISNGPTFTEKYTYDALGGRKTIEYPGCTSCGTLTPPARTVTNVYTARLLTEVTGYTNAISYHPNGVLATLKRRNANGLDGPTLTQALDAANRMTRPATTTMTRHCEFAITMQPPASKTVAPNEPANVAVTAPGATTFEWYVLGSTTKIANQTTHLLTAPVSETTQFWVRVGNGTCTVDSGIATVFVQSCAAPGTAITAPASIAPSSEATATVAGTGTYSWSIAPGTGTIVSGQNAQTVTFRSSCAGPVSLSVQVTAACGTAATGTKSVTVAIPSVTVGASPSAIVQGQSTTLSVSIAGGPWSVAWSDGFVQNGVTGSASRPAVSPSQTTTYSVTNVNGCAGSYGSKTVVVSPPAPVATTASRSSGGMQITWIMPQGTSTDSYIVERCASACVNAASEWLTVGNATLASYFDASVASGKAYAYRVRAVKAGVASAPGPLDLATNIGFSDDPIMAGATPIRLAHLAELRGAANAVRTVAGLAPASFTDALEAGLMVRTLHLTQLRSAVNAARAQCGFGPVTFDPPLTAGESIRAVHVNQLRGGVR